MHKPTAYHIELTGPEYAPVRVLTLNKSPWFVLDDVLKASGASESDLDPFPDFGRETVLLPGGSGNERVNIVDESAFLWLSLRGWKRNAGTPERCFADWVVTVSSPPPANRKHAAFWYANTSVFSQVVSLPRRLLMHNAQSVDITVNIITTLLHALTEISAVSGEACQHTSRDSEYAGAVVPHSLAVIQQRADMAMQQVSAMMLVDIQSTGEAENA